MNECSDTFCFQSCQLFIVVHYAAQLAKTGFDFAMSRCSSGYTGNPQTPGGSCQECECDRYGSLPVPCDAVTGQCTCKPGFTGWKCAGCEHRHARDGMRCICTYTDIILDTFWMCLSYFRNSTLLMHQSVLWVSLKIILPGFLVLHHSGPFVCLFSPQALGC